MAAYLIRRAGLLALTVLMTSFIVFFVSQWLPGDIARVILGREAGQQAVEELRQELGLNEPPAVQYLHWLSRFLVGDWGESFSTKTAIQPVVLERLRNSLMLAGLTLVIAIPLAVGLGVWAGLKENTAVDHAVSISSLSVVGLPEFITGLVLIQIFAFRLDWLPANSSISPGTGFFEALPMLILPALAASLVLIAYVTRLTRAGVIEELKQPYVRTAELKGLSRWTVILHHVLRNALLPTITVVAISVGWLISGLVVIENVFNYPGLGRLMVFAIDRRDIPLIQAITLITVLCFALANFTADILYAYLNPRIRYK